MNEHCEFSVCQFFIDGQHEYVRRCVSSAEAVSVFSHYIRSVGAQIGTTTRVIITDGGDCVAAEWQHGKGITFPPPAAQLAQQPKKER